MPVSPLEQLLIMKMSTYKLENAGTEAAALLWSLGSSVTAKTHCL